MKSAVTDPQLTLTQARSLQLAAMGLLTRPRRRAKKADVLAAIRTMNVLQIDTIHIVARSPYLVLWSRLGDYDPAWLDAHLREGALFEYWAHAACFLPMEDYPQYRRQMLHLEAAGSARSALQLAAEPLAHLELVEHVREYGPVRAADFEHENGRQANVKNAGWWNWKPDKQRLETLFTAGEIMVKRRENFHRVYDLRERVLPSHFLDDSAVPSRAAVDQGGRSLRSRRWASRLRAGSVTTSGMPVGCHVRIRTRWLTPGNYCVFGSPIGPGLGMYIAIIRPG